MPYVKSCDIMFKKKKKKDYDISINLQSLK